MSGHICLKFIKVFANEHSQKTWVTVLECVVEGEQAKVLIGTSQLLWFVYGFGTVEQQINNVPNANNLYTLKNFKRNRRIHDFLTTRTIYTFAINPAMQLLSNQ